VLIAPDGACETQSLTILFSTSRRPWQRHRMSLVSLAFARMLGCEFSHASIETDARIYSMISSGLRVTDRSDFERRMLRVVKGATVRVPRAAWEAFLEVEKGYDWPAVASGARAVLSAESLPSAPVKTPFFTCCSFVATACRLAGPQGGLVNRYVTTKELARELRPVAPTAARLQAELIDDEAAANCDDAAAGREGVLLRLLAWFIWAVASFATATWTPYVVRKLSANVQTPRAPCDRNGY
jgi:hypothetical protein